MEVLETLELSLDEQEADQQSPDIDMERKRFAEHLDTVIAQMDPMPTSMSLENVSR